MKIYTKTGDKGTTSLFGGMRVTKDNLRIESYGTVDELSSLLGIVLVNIDNKNLKNTILKIQNQLFNVGADLASPITDKKESRYIERIDASYIVYLETKIDYYEEQLEPLQNFILPCGNAGASHLHFARTICRKAERIVVALKKTETINENVLIYLNRLSDLLFVLARYSNHLEGIPDVIWQK